MNPSKILLFRAGSTLNQSLKETANKGRTVFYPGSFNPLTRGHMGVIAESALLADRIVVGIGFNPNKAANLMFTPDEREKLIFNIVGLPNRTIV